MAKDDSGSGDGNNNNSNNNNNNNHGSINIDDPLILHSNDLSCVSIVNFKLQGTINYKSWASATELSLRARNKLGFVNGSCPRPTTDEIKGRQWDRADAVVLSWLLGSISENLYASHVLSKSSSEVWNDLKETYEKLDGSVVYSVYQNINQCVQGSDTLSDYYNKLTSLWKEFDALTNLASCTCEAAKGFESHSQQIKLMQFLMGLDDSFSNVRSNILMREPLPSVKSAFAICSREESYKAGSSSGSNFKNPNSAFFGKVNDNKKKFNNNNKAPLVCKNCGLKGHTIERCYKLIGFPKDFKGKSESSAQSNKTFANNCQQSDNKTESPKSDKLESNSGNNSTFNNGSFSLTPEQMSRLMSLLNEKSSFNPVANMAGLNLSFQNKNIDWVIDSGANQHFTTNENNLSDVVDISDLNLKVDHPNGSSAKILKIGSIFLNESIGLFDVLVVPEFNVNLLSVYKVVKDNKLRVIFD